MKYEEEYDFLEDEEEIDIVKLVSTNANDSNQYLLFLGQDEHYYAKNVSKIEEIVVYKNLEVVPNYDDNIILGVADIRGEMLGLVSFDRWLCGEDYNENENEFVIVMNYGGEKFGLVVKAVDSILTIETKDMASTGNGNSKSSFTAKIMVNNKLVMCTVIDSDRMLLETFPHNEEKVSSELLEAKITNSSERLVFFADDSKLIQNLMRKVCEKLQLNYKIFDNGEALWQNLCGCDLDDVGLVVTDLEMPVLGGKELLKRIRNKDEFNEVDIVVHSNMVNEVMRKDLEALGANNIINKVDVATLTNAVSQHLR